MEDEVEKVSLEMIKKGEHWLQPPGIQGKKMAYTPVECPKCVVWVDVADSAISENSDEPR